MRCQICLGISAARLNPASLLHLLPSCFSQPVYHEASPVMIQRGRCAGDNDSSSASSSNSNNNDNNHSTNNSTRIKLWSGLWPKISGG